MREFLIDRLPFLVVAFLAGSAWGYSEGAVDVAGLIDSRYSCALKGE